MPQLWWRLILLVTARADEYGCAIRTESFLPLRHSLTNAGEQQRLFANSALTTNPISSCKNPTATTKIGRASSTRAMQI